MGKTLSKAGVAVTGAVGAMVMAGSKWSAEVAGQQFLYNNLDTAIQKTITSESRHANSIGLTEQQYKNSATSIATYYKNMGMTTQETSRLSAESMNLVADLAAITDMPFDEAMDRFKSGLMGNYEALDAFGINVSARSLENSEFVKGLGKSWNQLSDNEKMMAVYNEIVRQSSSAQGLAKQEAQSFGMQMKLLKEKIMETAGAIGEKLLPYLEPFIQKMNEIVEAVGNFANEHPQLMAGILGVAGAIGGLMLVLGPVLMVVGQLMTGFASATVVAGVLGTTVGAMALVFVKVIAVIGAVIAIGALLYANWDTIKRKALELWQNIKIAWNSIKRSTIQIWNSIKTTITNVWNNLKSTATNIFNNIKTVISNIWNNVKTITINTWNNLKSGLTSMWNGLKSVATSVFNAIKTVISNIWNNVKSTTTSIWNSIKSSITSILNGIKSTFTNILNAIKNAVKTGMNNVKSTMVNIMNQAKSAISNMVGRFASVGRNIVNGIANGIKSGASAVINAAANVAKSALNAAKKFLGIHSPSKVMAQEVGRFIPSGMAVGITANIDSLKSAVREMTGIGIEPAIASVSDIDYSGAMNYQKFNPGTDNIMSEDTTPQPMYINFRFGNRKFKGFVKDITRAQDTEIELIEEYGI
ncbi:phage tail tape measure protein [Peptacetobacter sp. AB845]|uniref:phage tail tape measure protein n=1 Tax=Peptacetobacter sp. AB845 TaxID=3388429 RepID=UPI0039C96C42